MYIKGLKRAKKGYIMGYSKKEIYKLTKRLYYLLSHHSDHIHFEKLYSNVYGFYDDKTQDITIDYRRDIIPTLIHEALHHWHPDWSETKVIKHESLIINALTPKQIKNIIKAIADNV